MSIRFILAPAGGGKTYTCIKEIAAKSSDDPLGQPIYFILPEQATFIHERLLCEAGPGKGFCRAHVCSFNRLIHYAYQASGEQPKPLLSEAGKLLLAGRVISEARDQLEVFAKSASSPGFAAYLVQAAEELAVYGIDPDELDASVARLATQDGKTRQVSRLHEIALLNRLYQQSTSDAFSSYAIDMSYLSQSIEQGFLAGADIYFDGYAEFTPTQIKMIEALLQRPKGRVTIALPIDPGLLEEGKQAHHIFRTPLHTWSKLSALADKLGTVIEEPLLLDGREGRFSANRELAVVEAVISGREPVLRYKEEPKKISLNQAPNRRAELIGIGREIVRLTREEGLRFRDISLIVRDTAPYEQLIEEVFRDMKIPYFIDAKKSLLWHPLFELIRAALENWAYKPTYQHMMRFCKNSLIPIDKDEADLLDNYTLAHGLRFWHWQKEQPWDFPLLPDEEEKTAAKVEAIRQKASMPLIRFIQDFPQKSNAQELNQGLERLLNELGIAKSLEKSTELAVKEGRSEEAAQHQQAWDKLIGFLAEAGDLLADEQFVATDLSKLYDEALKGLTVSTIPPGIDQVFVASLERSRSPELKASFVINLNEGVIPQRIISDGLFTDEDRNDLRQAGADLAPDTYARQFGEDYLSYIALTRSSNLLYLSYINQDEQGKDMRPSPLIRQLKAALPSLASKSFEPFGPEQLIGGELDMAQMAVQLGKSQANQADIDFWSAVYAYYANDPIYDKELAQLQRGLFYRSLTKPLSASTREQLFGNTIHGSVSRLEKFRLCPFAYFANYGLKLKKRPLYQLDPAAKGQLYHEVLAQIGDRVIEQGLAWQEIDKALAGQLVEDALADQLPQLLAGILRSSARYLYLSQRIKAALIGAVLILAEHAKRGEFIPVAWELPFGSDEKKSLPAFKIDLPDGKVLELSGRIDRVDMAMNFSGENSYFRIIDYKSGKPSLDIEDIANGLRLQLLVYLQVVMMNSSVFSPKPAKAGGIFYANVSDSLTIAREDSKKSPEGLRLTGLTVRDEEAIKLADKDIKGRSELIPIHLGKNGISDRPAGLSDEQLIFLQERLTELLGSTASEMLDGVISVSPLRDKDIDACAYCDFANVCGFDQKLANPRQKDDAGIADNSNQADKGDKSNGQ